MVNKENYQIFACLPFVELAHEASFGFGPFIFWPASKYQQFIPYSAYGVFEDYIQTMGQVKARTNDEEVPFLNTVKLVPSGTTCISIDKNVPIHQREAALVDVLYLLYFACTFRNLYYDDEVPSFDVFRKIIPAALDFIQHKSNWENLHIEESRREDTVCIHLVDHEICQALGQTLSALYLGYSGNPQLFDRYTRLIRSIRYFIDRFVPRFVNLFGEGLNFPEYLYEPENIIFLGSSFEALFDISEKNPQADFKHKVRPILHLKFSHPVELFWKWTDDFFEARRMLIHGGPLPDPIFRGNPNFEISHILIGIKLFIYSIYYGLFKYRLLPAHHDDPFTPPDFKWIHPDEVLLFFWTEARLLHKINLFLKQTSYETLIEERKVDIHFLTTLFSSMQERFYEKPRRLGIKFLPSSQESLQEDGNEIMEWLEAHPQLKSDPHFMDPSFASFLQQRLVYSLS